MTLFGFSLVMTAALCHAVWNFLVKRIGGGAELIWLFSVVALIAYFPLALYIIIVEQPTLGLGEFAILVVSALLHMGYFLLLQAGYRNGDLSLVYPTARATGPLLSASFAIAFLGEPLTLQIGAGAIAIIVGVVNLTGGFSKRSGNIAGSLIFGLGAGAFIGSYTVWDAWAVSIVMISPILLDYASGVTRSTLLAPVAFKRWSAVRRMWREHWIAIVAVGLINPLAYILVLYALTFTPVVYVAPARETRVLLGVLMGALLLGEGGLRHRMIWAGVILAGLTLLVTG